MKRLLAPILALCVIGLVIVLLVTRAKLGRAEERASRYRELCTRMKLGLNIAANRLVSASPSVQRLALQNFLSLDPQTPMNLDPEDVALCAGHRIDMSHTQCASGPEQPACLSKLATSVADAIQRYVDE